MEKRKRGRPARGYPYVCGPYRHGAGWRLIIVTGRSGGRRASYHRAFETRPAALVWASEFRRQVAAGGRTVEAAVIAYTDHLRRQGNKEGSITTTKHRLRALLDYGQALLDLTPPTAQVLYDKLVDSGVAADTHRGCLVAGRAFGKFCVAKGWIRINPFTNVLPVGRKARGKAQLRTDEARTLMRHCYAAWRNDKDRGAVATLLALMFSMRASEVAQLVARDVDDRGHVLRIAEHQAKTAAAVRSAAVPAPMVPILRELAEKPATDDGHLFAMESGKAADRHWVLRVAKAHMKAAGVPVLTAHGLRGTSATIGTVASGAQVMADALGHEDTRITKAAYIDKNAAANAAAERLAGLLDDAE